MHTIQTSLRNSKIRAALSGLVGCPVGGWPRTREARFQLWDVLPHRRERNYTANDLIYAALGEVNGHYVWKEG
jgi:hypothetical protein